MKILFQFFIMLLFQQHGSSTDILSEVMSCTACLFQCTSQFLIMLLLHKQTQFHLSGLFFIDQPHPIAFCQFSPEKHSKYTCQNDAAPFRKPAANNWIIQRPYAVCCQRYCVNDGSCKKRNALHPFRIEKRS